MSKIPNSTQAVQQRLLEVMRQRAANSPAAQIADIRRSLGRPTADRLLRHLNWQAGRLFLDLYQGKGLVQINGRKYMYASIKNSPIILGNERDISHYKVTAEHPDFEGRGPQTMHYLEKYLLIPTRSGKLIFVSDTHNHALFGWALSKEIGLTDKNAALVHVDAHFDESIPSYPGAGVRVHLGTKALEYITGFRHEHNFLYDKANGFLNSRADAFSLEMMRDYHCETEAERSAINELYKHSQAWQAGHPGRGESLADFAAWSRRYADICSFISPAEGTLFKDLVYVLTRENGQGTDRHQSDFHGMRQEGQIVSIELMLDRVRQLKSQGRKVILDLDLDYFAHYFQLEHDSGTEAKDRITFEDNFAQVVALAQEADFITVATSPDWFMDQQGKAREILERFITAVR